MQLSLKQSIFLNTLLISIFFSAWFIQIHLLIKGDVIWLFHLAAKVLQGGKYVQDFFEVNPPLSIYLYMPAVIISKLFSWAPIFSLRCYVFLLAWLSYLLCYYQVKKIFSAQDAWGGVVLLTLIMAVFIIFPASEFGQRENLLVILTMPYFLSVVCHLQEKRLPAALSLVIGVFAGIGFAIKPFYMLALVFIETYKLLHAKRLLAVCRMETFGIAAVLITYLGLVSWFNEDYIHHVVPIAAQFYYLAFASSVWYLILMPIFYYCIFAVGLYVVQYSSMAKQKYLLTILLLAMCGFLGGYLLQRIPWYYHIYPAFSLSVIYFGLMFYVIAKNNLKIPNFSALLSFCLVMWLLLAYYYSASELIWYIHFCFLFALLGYSYYAWKKNKNVKGYFLTAIAFIFFTYPANFILQYIELGYQQKAKLFNLIQLIQQRENNKSVYFFSSMSAYMVSVLEHADAIHPSRLQFLAWMRYLYNHPLTAQAENPAYQTINQYFIQMLSQDIDKNKPDWILVDEQAYPVPQGDRAIDYVAYLNKDPAFKAVWLHYHYLMTVQNPDFPYQFKIYEREEK